MEQGIDDVDVAVAVGRHALEPGDVAAAVAVVTEREQPAVVGSEALHPEVQGVGDEQLAGRCEPEIGGVVEVAGGIVVGAEAAQVMAIAREHVDAVTERVGDVEFAAVRVDGDAGGLGEFDVDGQAPDFIRTCVDDEDAGELGIGEVDAAVVACRHADRRRQRPFVCAPQQVVATARAVETVYAVGAGIGDEDHFAHGDHGHRPDEMDRASAEYRPFEPGEHTLVDAEVGRRGERRLEGDARVLRGPRPGQRFDGGRGRRGDVAEGAVAQRFGTAGEQGRAGEGRQPAAWSTFQKKDLRSSSRACVRSRSNAPWRSRECTISPRISTRR